MDDAMKMLGSVMSFMADADAAAMPAGAYKGLLNVRFAHAQLGHATGKLGCFFLANGKCAHVAGTCHNLDYHTGK